MTMPAQFLMGSVQHMNQLKILPQVAVACSGCYGERQLVWMERQ